MMKNRYRSYNKHLNIKGFTLGELLITIAIIAVLVAVSIPILASSLDRTCAATDMANVRSAKAAAAAEYMSDQPGDSVTYYYDAVNGKVTTDRTKAAAFEGFGRSDKAVKGASGIPKKDGKAQIVAVTYDADGSISAAWGMGTELDSMIDNALAYIASKGNKYYSGSDLINSVGTLEPVATSELFGSANVYQAGDTLYWRPYQFTVNGKKNVFLYASNGSSGTANWQGYAIYYNGRTYKSKNLMSNGTVNRNSVMVSNVGSDLETYLIGTGKWE